MVWLMLALIYWAWTAAENNRAAREHEQMQLYLTVHEATKDYYENYKD